MCPAGKWSANEAETCTSCAAGKSSAATEATAISTCVDCVAGKFKATAGAGTCKDCESGKYKGADGQGCERTGGFVWQWGVKAQTCTATCEAADLVCVEKFAIMDNKADLDAVLSNVKNPGTYLRGDTPPLNGRVNCAGLLLGWTSRWSPCQYYVPGRYGNNCYWQPQEPKDNGYGTTATCADSDSDYTRLCSCQCAAGSFSPSDTQPYPCTRYDKIPTLPSHLRLRKARPTQLFLSLYFSSHNRAFAFFRV